MRHGHSNVHAKQTEIWPNELKVPNAKEIARIPLEGGAGVYTVRELPPLALTREEWETIGRRMSWLSDAATTKKGDWRQ